MNKLQKSLLIVFALLAFGQTAWAQEKEITWTEVGTKEALNMAITNGANIRLTADITLSAYLRIGQSNNQTVTIDLNGHTLSRNLSSVDADGHVIEVFSNGTLTLQDNSANHTGKLTGGWANNGGGICNKGTLTLNNVTITGCKAVDGGGIKSFEGATLTITGGAITNCRSDAGGGGVVNYGTANISGCTFSGNIATTRGGAIWSNSALTVSSCSFNSNQALAVGGGDQNEGDGGAIHVNGGTATLTNVTISNNTSKDAGGIYVASGATLNLGGTSTISGNTSSEHGGGGIVNQGTVNLSGDVSITGNTCATNGGGIWNNATLNVQGKLIVSNNTGSSSTTSNLYLNSANAVTVGGVLSSDSSIGLRRTAGLAGAYVTGFATNNPEADPDDFFTDDIDATGHHYALGGDDLYRVQRGGNTVSANYLTDDGTPTTMPGCHPMSALTDEAGITLEPGWYVVDANCSFSNRITTVGEVNLILKDATVLTSYQGIFVPEGSTFHVWGQRLDNPVENPMGVLMVTARTADNNAGIGANYGMPGGTIHIHGGLVNAAGSGEAAGIGGSSAAAPVEGIIISGGNVAAFGDSDAEFGGAGIGGGAGYLAPDITITGGEVYAVGGTDAAGIGSGFCGKYCWAEENHYVGPQYAHTIHITGGIITAIGSGNGAGIGGGGSTLGQFTGCAGNIYIDGGTVNASTLSIAPVTYPSQAIGHGALSGVNNDASVYIGILRLYDGAKVSATTTDGNLTVLPKDERINAIGELGPKNNPYCYKEVKIEPCNHPGGCSYSENTTNHNIDVSCANCYTHLPYTFENAGNWNTASNWLGSIQPATGSNVAVKAAAVIPAGITANVGNIDMQTGGSITIADGGQLKHSNAVPGTIQKSITGYGDISNPEGWYLLGAPLRMNPALAVNSGMVDLVNDQVDFDTRGIDLYEFSQNQELEWKNMRKDNRFSMMGVTVNAAYLYARADDCTLNFSTTEDELFAPTTSDTYIVATRAMTTPEPEFVGWNLIRNPYTCNAYLASGRDFYRMNATHDAIVLATAQNGGTAIKPCEGFFVVVGEHDDEEQFQNPTTGSTVSANIQMTTTEPQPSGNKGMLDITVKRGDLLADVARVRFGHGDRTGKLVLRNEATRLSIMQDGKECSVVNVGRDAARHVSTEVNEIPVNFKAKENGQYTISVNPEGVEMGYLHLIDNMTGADVDLLALRQAQGPAEYTFSAKTTDYASRFKLVFSSICEDANGDNETFAFVSNGNIIVNGEGVLHVIDMTGRVIVSRDAARHVSTSEMTPGVYVLCLINGDDVKTQKVVIE